MSAGDVTRDTFPVQRGRVELESTFLGHLLFAPEVNAPHVPDDLRPLHFTGSHRWVFEAYRTLVARGVLPTIHTVDIELARIRRKGQVGLLISEAIRGATGSGSPAQMKAHAETIVGMSAGDDMSGATREVLAELELGRLTPAAAAERLHAIAEGVPTKAATAPSNRFAKHARSICEVMPAVLAELPAEPRWLLHRGDDSVSTRKSGVLRAGKVGLLVAAGGVGKTQALVQLAIAVAAGGWWLGTFHVAEPGRVLLALAEEDADEVNRRLYHAAKIIGLNDEERRDVLDRIVAMPLAGVPLSLVEHDRDGNVTTTEACRELRAVLDAGGPWRLVVLDPLSRWAGSDTEKDNAAATRFVQTVESLTTAPGEPTVLVAHHSPASTRAASGAAPSPRGVTGLSDGARWVATLAPIEVDDKRPLPFEAVEFRIVKSNYGPKGDPVVLAREAKHIGALRPLTVGERAELEEAKRGKSNGAIASPKASPPSGPPTSKPGAIPRWET